MASVDTLPAASAAFSDPSPARREQELQAGRLKLEQFKQKKKNKKANVRTSGPAEPTRFNQGEPRFQQENDQPTAADLDSEVYVPGSQNGFSVLNGGRAKENPSIIQDRVQGWKQIGQTFALSDSNIGTGDFEKLVSTALHQDIGSNPFSRPNRDGIGAQDIQKFLHPSNDYLPKATFADANSPKVEMPTVLSGQPTVLGNGRGGASWGSNSSLNNLIPGGVQDIPEPDFLSEQSGIKTEIHTSSIGDGMASVSSSDWSSLAFSTPFMISPSKLPAEGTSSVYAYDNVPQMSISKPVSSLSPLLPHTEFPSITDPEIKRNSSSVSFPAKSFHNSPPKSLSVAGAPSSSISLTKSPLGPLSFKSAEPGLSQIVTPIAAQLENNRSDQGPFQHPTEFRSRPFSDSSSTLILDPPSFLISLSSSKPSPVTSKVTSSSKQKSLPLSKPLSSSFALSNHVYSSPLHSSLLQPVSSQPETVSIGGFDERLVGISEGREGQLPEFLPNLPTVSFLNQDMEDARKCEQEEFLSLEQHIEDLTQEKFSLQRSLDKERAIAESLVLENTMLVEDFNNQGQVVQKLNDDIVVLEEKVLAQEAMLKSMRAERDKAQQESSLAIEQSQTLAGEVIALENQVRTLRSHELRLERDMESLTSDVDAYKRQIASLEKDQAHWETIVDALQEEKKLMQGCLRKAAFSDDAQTREISLAVQQREQVVADASTSTDDLVTELPTPAGQTSSLLSDPLWLGSWEHSQEPESKSMGQTSEQPNLLSLESAAPLRLQDQVLQPPFPSAPLSEHSSSHLLSVDLAHSSSLGLTSGIHRSIYFPAVSSSIPPDLLRTINSINTVIKSLSEEKRAVLKALKAESTAAAELRALNSDMSQKLEAQTQQLELAVTQRMTQGSRASVVFASKVTTVATDFVDEGDEVVDRVLGWIMHLFPGGTSRRNGVKRL